MKEILYLDRKRFDSYSAQAAPSLAKVEKTKEFGAEFAITGPKASFGQKERLRALTDFERMDLIVGALERDGDLRTNRPDTEDDGPAYVHEECEAVKVIVTHTASRGDFKTPEFVLWLSAAPGDRDPPGCACSRTTAAPMNDQ